jgi:hypothetical protein
MLLEPMVSNRAARLSIRNRRGWNFMEDTDQVLAGPIYVAWYLLGLTTQRYRVSSGESEKTSPPSHRLSRSQLYDRAQPQLELENASNLFVSIVFLSFSNVQVAFLRLCGRNVPVSEPCQTHSCSESSKMRQPKLPNGNDKNIYAGLFKRREK